MNPNLSHRIFILILCCVFGAGVSKAQLNVTDNVTAQQMIDKLVGPNVAVLNPILKCQAGHSGTFETVTSNLGLPGGIVLCTGYAKTSGTHIGVDGSSGMSIGIDLGPVGYDADLSNLSGYGTTKSCILEFDFVPDVDTISTLRFKYVFGSEEYPGYTCSQFNDVFGFLLSSNSSPIPINIALVPNTNIPVTINSVNSGTASFPYPLSTCQAMGPGAPFPQYFVNNLAQAGQSVTLDGFTTVLEASAVVVPCDTYHMKMGVANAVDSALQSAVFLQANSFTVDTVKLNLDGIVKSDYGYLVEGCTPADIIAARSQPSPHKKKICLEYSGTALNGFDYTFLPDTLIIPPYGTVGMLTLNPLQDNLPEPGYETVIIRRVNCCTKTPIDSITIKIRDSLKLEILSVDTLLCGKDTVKLRASGDSAFHYLWTATIPNPNIVDPTDTFTYAFPDTTAIFTITATFKGCPPVSRSFEAAVEPLPIVNIGITDTTVCLRDSMMILADVGPKYFNSYVYNWAPNTHLSDPSVKQPKFFAQDIHDYLYVLTVQTPHGCTGKDTALIRARTPVNLDEVTADTIIRYGNKIQLYATGADYYFWEPPYTLNDAHINNPIAAPLEPTMYTVYGVSNYGCRDTATVKVDIDYNMSEFIPNAFSPNGDGLNDKFGVFNLRFQKLIEFRVFNRWGEEVFYTTDPLIGWDGNYKGVPQDPATFNYLIRVARPDGTIKSYKGDVILIR